MERKDRKLSIDKVIGDNLVKIRKERKFSRDELADLVGITASHLGLIERGERGITAVNFSTFKQVLDVPVDYFFNEEVDSQASDDENMELIGRKRKIHSLINFLDEEKLDFLIMSAKALMAMK